MPNFLDRLNANVTNATRTVAQKAKNLNESNKLNSQIKAEEHNIQQNLIAIGQKYYELCKDSPDEEFKTMVEAIVESEQKIEKFKQEIEEVRAREPELVPIPEQVTVAKPANTPANPSAMVCTNCGKIYEAGNLFCGSCGQKLTAQYTATDVSVQAETENAVEVSSENDTQVQQEITDTPEIDIMDAMNSEQEQAIAKEEEQVSKPAFCPYCGSELNVPGQIYCGGCGKKLAE
ncbi:MAG: hypothetical protein K2O52_03065 [Oscillospiraceae bacterium]|nr:hypothetical protein [Oscillospiraceae bacterium]MDE7093874.1 hypothetical protein [Oscillospiraceae bacterium]